VRLLLLHSPLVGPATWQRLAPLLSARGHDVIVPDFTPVMRGAGPYYPALVRSVCDAAGSSADTPTILIAHSGAGALVPMMARTLGGDVGAVFLDALLPHPGQSWFDTTPDTLTQHLWSLAQNGRLPPWPEWWPRGAIAKMMDDPVLYDVFAGECPMLPLSYFEEVAPVAVDPMRCAYLQLSESYTTEQRTAVANGWPTRTLPLHHLALLTHAEDVIGVLDEILASLDSHRR
jgi:pimeloyl-ACP methyl ester carboxylesterase